MKQSNNSTPESSRRWSMPRVTVMDFLRYLPLLAPLPEGYAIYVSLVTRLRWDEWAAFVSALVVAGTGFFGVQVYNRMVEHNEKLKAKEKAERLEAPTRPVVIVLAIWFIAVTVIIVMLEPVVSISTFIPPILVIVGFCSAWLFGLSNAQATREQLLSKHRAKAEKEKETSKKDRAKAEAERQAEENRQKELAAIEASQKQAEEKARKLQLDELRDRIATRLNGHGVRDTGKVKYEALLFEMLQQPDISDLDLAGRFGVTRQAVNGRRNELVKMGVIRMRGGRVELIEEEPNDSHATI